ncbi:TOM1-like protein 2 isoform X2 [Ornithodoros turicata]|uniref:TOM1-like protein 2 isoform X2 n=1 Tax=Ornithodoros turicata TaxID=34597 RepID=UPI0031391FA7
MSAILAQLGGNPFNTPVGQKIEQATDASLASENWALNMEICDIINDTDEGPKDALRAVRKRLQQNAGKNYTVVMYSLTVLETCVKNCGKRFHLLVSQKDFVQELVKMIGPKNDPPTAVQEKVLSLIQSWADAFRTHPDMQGVVQVYTDLRNKGVEFPPTDLDAMAPIYTPQRSVPPALLNTQPRPVTRPVVVQEGPPSPVQLSPEQLSKLKHELDMVQRNMTVFGDMLSQLTPGQEQRSDWELMQELQKTCHAMQTRIVELVDKVANEEVTGELLRLNDDLNNLFLRYERFEKRRMAVLTSQPKEPSRQAEGAGENVAPLIDLGEPDVTTELQNLAIGGGSTAVAPSSAASANAGSNPSTKGGVDEFDMFAQSRHAFDQGRSGSTYADNTSGDQLGVSLGALAQVRSQKKTEENGEPAIEYKDRDFDEMEQWLKEKPVTETSGQESITSSEFDRFLAERAAAAERLPNVTATTGSSAATHSSPAAHAAPRNRMEREEAAENSLFAL